MATASRSTSARSKAPAAGSSAPPAAAAAPAGAANTASHHPVDEQGRTFFEVHLLQLENGMRRDSRLAQVRACHPIELLAEAYRRESGGYDGGSRG